MRINHNSLALNASDHFATINANIAKSMSRLSSGNKIVTPADDAAGLAISTKIDAQIRGLNRAALNSNDGVSVIQNAEGGMSEIHSILARMRELAVKASNDVLYEDDRDSIQEEINSLSEEINQITDSTAFNGQKLLNGDLTRRSLCEDPYINASFLSESVPVGEYEFKVTKEAKKAEMGLAITNSATVIDETLAGTIMFNGFGVEIKEGMTTQDIFSSLSLHLDKIGIDVTCVDGSGKEVEFAQGGTVKLETKNFGSEEKIEIKCENTKLAALFGVADGDKNSGEDCDIALITTEKGFKKSASYSVKGYDVTVIDRSGFEMHIDIEDESLQRKEFNKNGAYQVKIEVLSAGPMVVQTGANSGEQIKLDIPEVTIKGLGVDNLIMYTHEFANKAIDAIDEAVRKISNIRSKLGAYQNRLEDVYDNLKVQSESMTEAFSRIMDTDMAEEMTNYTQQDVLAQAAISMMKKSNERPESILQLLQ